jgi:multicomponent Na+:H+ antiporter subunit F
MSTTAAIEVDIWVAAVLAMIALAMVLALVRLALGPTLPDRVVALDVVANLAVGIIAGCAVAFDDPALLQPALVMALVAFIGTVAFARYLERRHSS